MPIPRETKTRPGRLSALELRLEGARLAFGCPYSGSDDYDAPLFEIEHRAIATATARRVVLTGMLILLSIGILVIS